MKNEDKSIPLGVKLSSWLYYLRTLILLIIGIVLVYTKTNKYFFYLGLILILLSIICFFVAINLWRGKNWARITAILISTLGIFLAIISPYPIPIVFNEISKVISFSMPLVHTAVNIIIISYLLLSKKAKHYFILKT